MIVSCTLNCDNNAVFVNNSWLLHICLLLERAYKICCPWFHSSCAIDRRTMTFKIVPFKFLGKSASTLLKSALVRDIYIQSSLYAVQVPVAIRLLKLTSNWLLVLPRWYVYLGFVGGSPATYETCVLESLTRLYSAIVNGALGLQWSL